jgi:hypothetical protein
MTYVSRIYEGFVSSERGYTRVPLEQVKDGYIYHKNIRFVYLDTSWYNWLYNQKITFRLRQADKITYTDAHDIQIFLEVVFQNKKDQILFELTWKGHYDE